MATRMEERAIEELGGAERVDEAIRRLEADVVYLLKNREELMRQHSEQWVAIHDRKVVARSKTLEGLLAEMDARGIPKGSALVHFLTTKAQALIL